MTQLLKITSLSEVKKSKDKRQYRTVGFKQVTDTMELEDGTKVRVLSNQPERKRNIWEKGPKQADGSFSAGDNIYPDLKVGAYVEGSIFTEKVAPFNIDDRMNITQYSCVVFTNEKKENYFRSQDHPIEGTAGYEEAVMAYAEKHGVPVTEGQDISHE